MNMQNWTKFLNYVTATYATVTKALPMRISFILSLIAGGVLVHLAITSNHPLAVDWVDTLQFEYGNRFLCLVTLYLAHRVINSEMRSHKLLDATKDNQASPVYVAWCATWVLSCALIIAFVS